jgi:phosphoglycerate dehydrogenase-like enzyme
VGGAGSAWITSHSHLRAIGALVGLTPRRPSDWRKASAAPAAASKEITVSAVTVVIGAGSIGQAIARRVSAGRHVLLADLRQGNTTFATWKLMHLGRC